jgi:hypothetical protein
VGTSLRLQLIYLGLIFLGVGNFVYRLKRPHVLRFGQDQFEYVDFALRNFTYRNYIDIHGSIRHEGHFTLDGKYYDSEWNKFQNDVKGRPEGDESGNHWGIMGNWIAAKHENEHLLRSMLSEYFVAKAFHTRRIWLISCLCISTIGYLLLSIPSIDIFLRVMTIIGKSLIF